MTYKRVFSVAVCAVAVPFFALAGPQYSSQDVVGYFNKPQPAEAEPDCPAGSICIPKKKTRAVCIGTGSACAQQEPVASAPGAFDLLITFDLGSDQLTAQAKENLTEFARALQDPALASTKFNVEGHTDARGSDEFNQKLSERRAAAVVRYLEQLGVDNARLQAAGYGEAKPRDTQDPFAAINRRVEATIRTQ